MQALNESSLIEEVLKYIVACYGAEIYQDKQRLSNLIADLYTGEERLKRLYRRMVMEDAVSQQLYAISLKPIQEREGFYNRLVFQFKEANFLDEVFARQVLDAFLNGMNLLLVEPISTKATEEDGEWVDEYGVKYSADRKKLIRAPENLYGDYRVLDGTIIICNCAFARCQFLYEIILPSSVTSIGEEAFWGCKILHEITLSLGVMSIGEGVFDRCSNLREINVAESNKAYRAIDGVLYTKDLKTIICYPAGKKNENFEIPSGVTSIGERAFFVCSNLETIILPSSVTSIGDGAFRGCWNLREITLLSNITSIGNLAFFACSSLETIILPSSVTSIGEKAFWECSNLHEITLPSSVMNIGKDAFDHYNFRERIKRINIPVGTLEKFKKLLPGWTNKLHEI